MHIDSFGLIQSGGDGGDTCHREYTLNLRLLLIFKLFIDRKIVSLPAIVQQIRDLMEKDMLSMDKVQVLLEAEPGVYRRHADPEFWGSDPNNCSRDQLTPVICLLAYLASSRGDLGTEYRAKLKALLVACIKRKMFAQNIYPNWVDARKDPTVKKKTPDFINFELWGIFARGWVNTWWFPIAIPFIILGDIFLVLSVAFKLWAPITKDSNGEFPELRWPQPDDVDDDNMNSCLMVSQHVYQTPLAWLARKMYKWFRQKNLGNTLLGEKDPIMGALMYYHRLPDGNPEIAELAREIVNNY